MGTTHLIIVIAVAGALLVAVVAGIWWFNSASDPNAMIERTVEQTISPDDLDIAFSFPSGPNGLTLIEPPLEGVAGGMLVDAFILMERAAYQEYQAAEAGATAPPSISVFVFEAEAATGTDAATSGERPDRMTRLRAWARENDALSSRSLATEEPTEVEVDGLDMLRYTAAGTYDQDIYLGLYRGQVYLLVGQYASTEDPIYADFQSFIERIRFK